MWFEVIPSAAIFMACYMLPIPLLYACHKLEYGIPYFRKVETRKECSFLLRDKRITGGKFSKYVGLENIPDE